MPRFFAELHDNGNAVIEGRDARHIQGPLRKRVGDEISVRDYIKGYSARIISISPARIGLTILKGYELHDRGAPEIYLGMSMIDMKDMDLVVREVTELGVAGIYPIIAERSNIRNIRDNRRDRWDTIITEAVKQCERRSIPFIKEPRPLREFLRSEGASWHMRLVASQNGETAIHDCRGEVSAGILIGPEGGFSPGEMEEIVECGFIPVTMGRTVMRSVTAAITAVGILGM